VGCEGPEGLDAAEGRDALDAVLVAHDFVPRRALLAEPEHPTVHARMRISFSSI
jgi:hypothetical protein